MSMSCFTFNKKGDWGEKQHRFAFAITRFLKLRKEGPEKCNRSSKTNKNDKLANAPH